MSEESKAIGLGALGHAKLGVERLPGTFSWNENVTVFVPVGLTSLVSLVATILLKLLLRR